MNTPITLTTNRLLLRPWKESDLLPFANLNADPQVMEFFPAVLSRRESDSLVIKIQEEFADRGFGLWAAEIPAKAEFIGFIGLHVPQFTTSFTPCVEIGWRIDKAFWGQGFAIEGARAVLTYGFETLQLEEIVSFTSENNLRSRKLMERLGMKRNPADDFEHPKLLDNDRLRSHVLYRLKHLDYLALKAHHLR